MLLFYCAELNELMTFEGTNPLLGHCIWRLPEDSFFRNEQESRMITEHYDENDPLKYSWELIGVV